MNDLDTADSAMLDLIQPDWPAPDNVRAFTTTRKDGFSKDPWNSLNLGIHGGDDTQHVRQNRLKLQKLLPTEPYWLDQVHGKHVVTLNEKSTTGSNADGAVATRAGQVCAVLHADCLPVLFCNRAGTKVAAAHAGWRGLVAGVLHATILTMACKPGELMAWLGPAIGPGAFEVGADVRDMFIDADTDNRHAFRQHGDRWLADLNQLARLALTKAGVKQVSGGHYCTYTEKDKFFSYRRDGVTGRMATMIWLAEPPDQ